MDLDRWQQLDSLLQSVLERTTAVQFGQAVGLCQMPLMERAGAEGSQQQTGDETECESDERVPNRDGVMRILAVGNDVCDVPANAEKQ